MNERFYTLFSYVLGFAIYLLLLMILTYADCLQVFDFVGRLAFSIGFAELVRRYVLND